jgi:hypothetical protein
MTPEAPEVLKNQTEHMWLPNPVLPLPEDQLPPRRRRPRPVDTLLPLPGPVLPPRPPLPDNPQPPLPEDNDSDDSDKSSAVKAVATVLAAAKNAVVSVLTHPVTPYAVGATIVAGACYFGYKWYMSESGESNADGEEENQEEENQEDGAKNGEEENQEDGAHIVSASTRPRERAAACASGP